MPEHEPWLTELFNEHAAGIANFARSLVKLPPLEHPWSSSASMEVLVIAIIVVMFALLRAGLSMDRPSTLQQFFEVIYEFLLGESKEHVGHDGPKHLPLFGTLFIFILFANLLGIIPTLESPTMFPEVPAGIALLAFVYYNIQGFREQGIGKYLAHFAGPMPVLAPLMIPIELVSHMARPLSLTIRLFANMLAGEKVTVVFLSITYLAAPALFMGLHVFVSFLQAYIFALMTMMYVAGAVAHEH